MMPFFPPLRGTLDNTMSGMDVMPQGASLQDILGASQGTTDMFSQQQAQQNEEPLTIKSETDVRTGQTKFTADNISQEAMRGIMDALNFKQKAVAGMQQEVERLQAQEQRARQNPLLNVLSTVAGNLAVSDPRLPPVVSALGRSSLMLNPTPDQLAARRIALLNDQSQVSEGGAGLALGLLADERHREQLAAQMQHQQQTEIAKRYGELSDAAQKGELTDASLAAKSLHAVGMDAQKAISEGMLLADISKQKKSLIDAAVNATSARDAAKFQAQSDMLDKRLAAMLAAAAGKENKADTARADRSYQFNSKQLTSLGDPIDQRFQRISTLQDTINQKTPQADALIAPELLTVMAGGQGSGLRMNEAEIARIIGGRTNLESLKAALNKWKLDPEKGLSVTDAQRSQIQRLVGTVSTKLQEKRELINSAHAKLIETEDPSEHRKIVTAAREALAAIDDGKPVLGVGGKVEKWVRDPKTGQLVKVAS